MTQHQDTGPFDLEVAIATWRRFVRSSRAISEEDADELEAHLRDEIADLVAAGAGPREAYRRASTGLGDPATLAAAYEAVHWRKQADEHRIGEELHWKYAMLKNYVTVAFRTLLKEKGASLINVVGLSIAMACCLLVFLYIHHERQYDRQHAHLDRIYLVGESDDASTNFWTRGRIVPALLDESPAVAGATRMETGSAWVGRDDQRFSEQALALDTTFTSVFTLPLLQGDPASFLSRPDAVAISASLARKYFAGADPLGEVLNVYFEDRVVTAVYADFPSNSTLQGDVLMPFDLVDGEYRNWDNTNTRSFVRLRAGVAPAQVAAQVQALVERHADPYRVAGTTFSLFPLRDYHLLADAGGGWTPGESVQQTLLLVLFIISLALALIAAINFANLATARALNRTREIGVRKVLGARPGQLMAQFCGDALLVSYLAAVAAGLLAAALVPGFNTLLGTDMTLDFTASPVPFWMLFGIATGVGLLAGLYPALVLSRFRPVEALRGRMQHSRRGAGVRNGLVVVQFTLSIVLVLGTLVMWRQIEYMKHRDLQFDAEGVVVVPLNPWDFPDAEAVAERVGTIKAELLRQNRITAVSTSGAVPGAYPNWGFTFYDEAQDQGAHANWCHVDDRYFALYGIDFVEGRGFSPDLQTETGGAAAVINEAMRTALGWDTAVGKTVRWGPEGDAIEVIGVVEDFNYKSLEQAVYPVVHFYGGPVSTGYGYMILKITPGPVEPVLAVVEEHVRALDPTWPFSYTFADERFNQVYEEVTRRATLVSGFAGVAILVACLGLLGLASFATAQRTKEIGVRKALGATVGGVVLLLVRDIVRLVVIAFVVAAPLGYVAMQRWLEGYHYRIDLGAGLILAAGAAALLIAVLTVAFQSVKAARANPVDSLRYE